MLKRHPHQHCIDACKECHEFCLHTMTHGLEKGGSYVEPHHLRLLLDCAEICATSANFLVRHSDLHAETCRACAEVCERCAENCERIDDHTMRRCAEVCRRCAESCRQTAGLGVMAGAGAMAGAR